MFIITKKDDIPNGFRRLTDEEIAKDFLTYDTDKSYTITKNEWMASFIKLLLNDIKSLDKESPDALMIKIQELSDEFDRYDVDNNKEIDYLEYKNFIMHNLLVEEI
ncbi:MAG: hypothetical protein E7Z87_06740 [Cyanobacteria bacterium SIG26]|nr:hypothetical protein [Cyanobacteria bacterium SIG26]